MSTRVLSSEIFEWINNACLGCQWWRNVTVYQVNPSNNRIMVQLDISEAFISDFILSDLDANSNDLGALSFVFVPRLIRTQTFGSSGGNPIGTVVATPTLRTANFRVNIDGLDDHSFIRVRGLRASWSKVLESHGGHSGRHEFTPSSSPALNHIQFDISTSGNTDFDLDDWLEDIADGDVETRNGEIELLNASFTTVIGRVELSGLLPLYFPIFGNAASQRTVTMQVGGFRLQ